MAIHIDENRARLFQASVFDKSMSYILLVDFGCDVDMQSFVIRLNGGKWSVESNRQYTIDNNGLFTVFRWGHAYSEGIVKYMLICLEEVSTWNDKVKELENKVEILQELLDRPGNAGAKYGYDQCAKLLQ
jgi:hypothetical protein